MSAIQKPTIKESVKDLATILVGATLLLLLTTALDAAFNIGITWLSTIL